MGRFESMQIILVIVLIGLVYSEAWNAAAKRSMKTAASSLLSVGLLGSPVLAEGFGISQVKETVRPFNELTPAAQRRFAVGLCKDGAALKKAGFASYPECTAAVFEGDYGIVTGEGADARVTKREKAKAEGKATEPAKGIGFDFSGGSKDASSQALKPGAAKTKGLQPKKLTASQIKQKEKTDAFKNDPLFQKLNANSKVEVLPIIDEK